MVHMWEPETLVFTMASIFKQLCVRERIANYKPASRAVWTNALAECGPVGWASRTWVTSLAFQQHELWRRRGLRLREAADATMLLWELDALLAAVTTVFRNCCLGSSGWGIDPSIVWAREHLTTTALLVTVGEIDFNIIGTLSDLILLSRVLHHAVAPSVPEIRDTLQSLKSLTAISRQLPHFYIQIPFC